MKRDGADARGNPDQQRQRQKACLRAQPAAPQIPELGKPAEGMRGDGGRSRLMLHVQFPPQPGAWEAIEARIARPALRPPARGFWNNIVLWRWSTAGLAAAAACLALWIGLAPAPGPSFVAVLHPPQQDQANWVATADRSGLLVRSVSAATAPNERVFELWAIAPGSASPRSLGVIPANGELKLSPLPPDLRDGATLAISIEPLGGSPTRQPTGPIVFVGTVKAV